MAAELARRELEARRARMQALRERLEAGLRQVPGVSLVAADAPRLPNTVQVLLPGMEGETLLMGLDRAGIAASSGSACSSGKREPSHVLRAMGVPEAEALSAVRLSLGADSTEAEVDQAVAALREQAEQLQGMAGLLLAG
jgi:cysteine desulfurase